MLGWGFFFGPRYHKSHPTTLLSGSQMAIPSEFFRTERLLFRPFAVEDIDAFHAIAGDPEVMRFVGDGDPCDRALTALWIERSRENVDRFGYGTGAVIERETGRFIGWSGVARPEGQPEEIVYGFARDAWGKGYATELVRGLILFAFGTLNLPELRATVDPENAVSAHILEKCGFVREPWEYDSESLLFVRTA